MGLALSPVKAPVSESWVVFSHVLMGQRSDFRGSLPPMLNFSACRVAVSSLSPGLQCCCCWSEHAQNSPFPASSWKWSAKIAISKHPFSTSVVLQHAPSQAPPYLCQAVFTSPPPTPPTPSLSQCKFNKPISKPSMPRAFKFKTFKCEAPHYI